MTDKVSKYKAKKTVIDGITFDSKVEGEYYKHLKSCKNLGVVTAFSLQPEYILQPKFKTRNGEDIQAIKYKADFEVDWHNGNVSVIDVKGYPTPDAKLKRKMFLAKFPEKDLVWTTYVKKHGGWIDYFELQKIRRSNNKKS